MNKSISELISSLSSDPEDFRQRRLRVRRLLREAEDQGTQMRRVSLDVELDRTEAAMLRVAEIFLGELMGKDEAEVAKYIFQAGLVAEMQRFAGARNRLFEAGNLELLADELGVALTEEERSIAAAPTKAVLRSEEDA